MNRNKQVGAFFARDFGTTAQRDEVIAGAGQLGAIAFHGIDLALQLTGNCQYHVFFMLAARAGSTRVFTAVTGIDHHDNVTLARGGRWRWRQLDLRLRRVDRHGRHRRNARRWRGWWVGIGGVVEQVDHEAIAVLGIRGQHEAFRGHDLFKVDHHTQIGRRTLSRAHGGNRCISRRHLERGGQGRTVDVDHQAIRRRQGKDAVLDRARQVEHQSRVIRRSPQAHTFHL